MTTYLLPLGKRIIPKRYHHPLLQKVYYLHSLFYRGNNVFCPWCGGHFRTFVQYREYIKPGLNTFCPQCRAFERQRLLWLYFKKRMDIFTSRLKVLHFAPEYMIQKSLKSLPNLEYWSCDIDSSLAMLSLDITHLPFPDNYFDVILCSHVLEHVVDDIKAMSELCRVLTDHGRAIVLTPVDFTKELTFEDFSITSSRERERLFGQHDHVRLYGLDFFSRLEKVGFKVVTDYFARELDHSIVDRLGLNKDEKIYICTKPSA
jgi:SAM-dependent methyltransferase